MKPDTQKSWEFFAIKLGKIGYRTFTFDFRGHGKSEGKKQYSKNDDDLVAAIAYARKEGAEKIVLIGASMGAMAAAKVASQDSFAAVVLMAPYFGSRRYAGPKEAVFTALSRQNFGCSHFIVGRDHTGVGDFYSPDASRRLFEELGDMAIQPIFFDEVYFCHLCGEHVQTCEHGQAPENGISGSQARRSLVNGETLPNWYMREPLSKLIIEEMRKGNEVFTP